MPPFVHLHGHSEYSILDGACRIRSSSSGRRSSRCPRSRSPTTARWPGAVELYRPAGKAGIQPLIGCEVYVVEDRRARSRSTQRNWAHLTLIAETTAGYHNLVKLVSLGYLEGFHYKPRVDFELLERYAGGLIALSGCLAGRVYQALLEDDAPRARGGARPPGADLRPRLGLRRAAGRRARRAPEGQRGAARLADETGLPLVGTGDVHYLRAEDADPHEVLLCIQTGDVLANPRRFRFPNKEFYFKTPEEMSASSRRTGRERCSRRRSRSPSAATSSSSSTRIRLPRFDGPATTRSAFLRRLCEQGLQRRYGTSTTRCATGSRSSCRRSARWASPTTS